jgi:hypothetical protein
MSLPQSHEVRASQERFPRYVACAVAGVFVVLGVAAAVLPESVIAASRYLVSPLGIFAAAALRVGIGAALLFSRKAPGRRRYFASWEQQC